MKLEMSYSTCQPLPQLQNNYNKRGSMPESGTSTERTNSGNFFPQISRSKGCHSAESNYNDDNTDGTTSLDGRAHSDTEQYNRNTSSTSYVSSVGTSRKGSPTKLPQIDVQYHKSKSVTSLCSNRSRNTPPRAEMCKSPSCPSLYSEYDDPGLVEHGDLNASIHPHHSRKSTGDAVKLPELYDNCTPRTSRSNSNGVKKSSKIEKEMQKLSLRRQREEEEMKQRIRKTHRQQQLDRQSSHPTALLLPIRNTKRPNHAKKESAKYCRQRQSESSCQSYNSSHSVQSDSGISASLRQSDTSDASGWEDGEGQRETEEDDDEYEDAADDDAGYEDEDEYEDTNDGYNYYDTNEQGYYNDRGEYKNYPQERQKDYCQEDCSIPAYRDVRYRRYKVAQSQNPQDYQACLDFDSTEKCQEWLDDRRKHQEQST